MSAVLPFAIVSGLGAAHTDYRYMDLNGSDRFKIGMDYFTTICKYGILWPITIPMTIVSFRSDIIKGIKAKYTDKK